jgi:hypothetical protein
MHRKAQLRGQQLPAKKGKVRARLVQTAQIQDWDNLTPAQQQEALNWGIDVSTLVQTQTKICQDKQVAAVHSRWQQQEVEPLVEVVCQEVVVVVSWGRRRR